MLLPRFVAMTFLVGLVVQGPGLVWSQNFPNKPIRIVASAPGGNGDFMARMVALETSGGFGQPVIVDNRSVVALIDVVSRAAPDGYTLAVVGNSFMIGHLLTKKPTYDPVRDFSPVVLVTSSPNVLVVHPSVAAKSVGELVALAKAKPGMLNYASAATGGPQHLSGELFKALAGVNIVRIPYKGNGPALNDLLGGQVQMMFATASGVMSHAKSGRLRALAVTSAQPTALVPGLPTMAASGVPGYESVQVLGLFAPAKTPATLITRLNQEIVRAVTRAEVKQKFFDSGNDIIGSSPREAADKLKSEIAVWGKVINDAGIREDEKSP